MNDYKVLVLILLLYFSPVFYQLFLVIRESRRGNKLPFKKFKKIIKYSLLILVPTSIVFLTLNHTNFLDYEKPLTFDKYDEISFENFRGLEFFKKELYGNERFAYVRTSIDIDISDDSATIRALFHPSQSFVYKSNISSEELLTHEKYHFKITELYSRRIKERISKLKNPSKEEVKRIINELKNEEYSFQKSYDYDTFHSYVLSEQKRYQKDIDSLLLVLVRFKKPKIEFHDKS